MKTLKFRADLAEKILKGEKTTTWRIFDDKDLTAGDKVSFLVWETGKEFAQVELTFVRTKKLGEVTEADFEEGHERYKDKEDMLASFRKYYGDKVDWDTELKIVGFRALS